MSDENLQPWLKSGAPGGVSRLLESAADDSPSPAALGKLAAKLATAGLLAPGGGGGGGGGDGGGGATHAPSHAANVAHHAATAAKPLAFGAKALLIGSLGVAVVGGGAFQAGRVVERRAQEQRLVAVAPTAAPAVLPPVAVTPPPPPPPVEEPAPTPEPLKPIVRPVPKPVETVNPDQEAELLTAAMKDSKDGHWAAALAGAEQHARRFPHGTLAQEREMIAIEALLNLSRRPDAERRAEKFRKQWPTSTHLVRLNTLLHGQ